jgi:hypothetical protein
MKKLDTYIKWKFKTLLTIINKIQNDSSENIVQIPKIYFNNFQHSKMKYQLPIENVPITQIAWQFKIKYLPTQNRKQKSENETKL